MKLSCLLSLFHLWSLNFKVELLLRNINHLINCKDIWAPRDPVFEVLWIDPVTQRPSVTHFLHLCIDSKLFLLTLVFGGLYNTFTYLNLKIAERHNIRRQGIITHHREKESTYCELMFQELQRVFYEGVPSLSVDKTSTVQQC